MLDHEIKFRLEKLETYLNLIGAGLVRETQNAEMITIQEPAEARFSAPPDEGEWTVIRPGERWGAAQQWAWFRAKLTVPEHWDSPAVELVLRHRADYLVEPRDENRPAGPEGQVFINGERAGAIDLAHHHIRYPFKAGETYDVRAVFFAARCECDHALDRFALRWVDPATEKLYHDLRVTLGIVRELPEASRVREKLIRAVEWAVEAIDTRDIVVASSPYHRRRDERHELLHLSAPYAQRKFDEAMELVEGSGDEAEVVAMGHGHIDLAWLWPIRQTRHKIVRTFSTQVRLLKQYEKWSFNQSSPQAYKWLEEDAPELWNRVRELIHAGRWEADGAMWVESDTNLPSGESLVRQFLYGKRYFQDRLGVDSRMLWLPDVFGYSAAMPQLMRLADVEGFVTSKISWNRWNRFPFDSFRWRGIDGTEVVTQFINTPSLSEGNWFFEYNSLALPKQILGNWERYRNRPNLTEPLHTFGFGDGGGGPTEEILETATRLEQMKPVAGFPKIKFDKASNLIRRLNEKAEELPVWDGELYLELHRGTYTTQGWLKRANRKNEILLHQLEWLATIAQRYDFELDKATLDSMWEDLLLTQFHDILPGSSVSEVYDDEIRPMMERIQREGTMIRDSAIEALTEKIDTSGMEQPVLLFNTLGWDRNDPVELPDGSWRNDVTVPAGGWALIDMAAPINESLGEALAVDDEGRLLENQYFTLQLNEQGQIAELYDKLNERAVLTPGEVGNEWQIFEDRVLNYDAWDIEIHAQQYRLPDPHFQSIQIVERGPHRAAVRVKWELPRIGKGAVSTIEQVIAIHANSPRIDFETKVDWREHHQLLKVAFPVDVRATEATYQIQYGHLRRPTHRNTTWDVAKFEVCAHQFADLAEHGYGVSLLNDCKYGYDAVGNLLRLTCIKSAQAPDFRADQGEHRFTYSLLAHEGTFQDAGTVRFAAELNNPVIVKPVEAREGELPPEYRHVFCEQESVVIDTLKPSEDGEGTIVRLYESHGAHVTATLDFAQTVGPVEVVNLLEEPLEDSQLGLEHDGSRIRLRLRPFQVVSLKLS